MIAIIKVGDNIYENIEGKVLQPTQFDQEGNPTAFQETFNPVLPKDLTGLKQAYIDTILWLGNKRVKEELMKRDWLDYGDVLESAMDTNDPDNAEAVAIQNWYKAYYTEIDNIIATIQGKQKIDTLLQLDLKALEEQAFQNAIQVAPLP